MNNISITENQLKNGLKFRFFSFKNESFINLAWYDKYPNFIIESSIGNFGYKSYIDFLEKLNKLKLDLEVNELKIKCDFKQSILDKLNSNSVVSFTFNKKNNKVEVTEECDAHFYVELNKIEMSILIEELTEIKNKMT